MSVRAFLAVFLSAAAAALPAGAETLETQPLFDVTATREGVEPWFLILGGTVTAEWMPSDQPPPNDLSSEARGVFEFDLGSIMPGASIQSATLNLNVVSFEKDVDEPFLDFYGYAGDGSADIEDPTYLSDLIGIHRPMTFTVGPISVSLSPGDVESLAQEGYLGIVMLQGAPKASTTVSSLENQASGDPATLSITFSAAIPEPSSLAALWGMALAAAALTHRRRCGRKKRAERSSLH